MKLSRQAPAAAAKAWRAILIDYLPFVTLLLALYTAGGGILLRGRFSGAPAGNVAMLVAGMLLGVVMGTTGASMLLIHPLLRANAHRRRRVHLVLFLVLLVANASGALTPLGNPPCILACCTQAGHSSARRNDRCCALRYLVIARSRA